MGAWAVGNFENDDALDWIWELEQAENLSTLREAFSTVTDLGTNDYLEAPECYIAVASAKAVAAASKSPTISAPPNLQSATSNFQRRPTSANIR
jgi:hypothetical protein